MRTVEDIIAFKEQEHPMFGNSYNWFFMTIQNDLVSKLNGSVRVKDFLSDYDYKAKLYVVHQMRKINHELAYELFLALDLDSENTFLENKYVDELVEDF